MPATIINPGVNRSGIYKPESPPLKPQLLHVKAKNTNTKNIKNVKATKHRSTNLELLGGVPLESLRLIREVALSADLPISRVFCDVLAIGISVITDPGQSPYTGLIAFREGLFTKQEELNVTRRAAGTLEETGQRSPDSQAGEQRVAAALHEADSGGLAGRIRLADPERSDDAPERSGLQPQDETANEVLSGVELSLNAQQLLTPQESPSEWEKDLS